MRYDELTAEMVRRLLHYDPLTGVFTRISHPQPFRIGKRADKRIKGQRYRKIAICTIPYLAHRIAWLYVHGRWPSELIDHVNGDPDDNRISNLREATARQNIMNSAKARNNTSGYKGVSQIRGTSKYKATFANKHLGTFGDPLVAHEAYLAAARKEYGEFVRAG